MSITALLALLTLSLIAPSSEAAVRYTEGQVWACHARPGDEGSLLKIQRIEEGPAHIGSIYHISVVGFRLANPAIRPLLPHAPVSRQTLDMSVTMLAADPGTFPDFEPGIEEWRRARGGVYTISVAQIIDSLDRMTQQPGNPIARGIQGNNRLASP